MWIVFACLSALFAGITSILAKCGIRHTDSDVATAIRTIVVLVFSFVMVGLVGSFSTLASIPASTLVFLLLSGLATGASWLCYFRALQLADVSKVVPVDKCSILLSVLFAMVFLGETQHLALRLGALALIGAGTLLMVAQPSGAQHSAGGKWLVYAVGSAVFAACVSILGKLGIEGVESNLGVAIRTSVVLVMAWVLVAVQKKTGLVRTIARRELWMILLSGCATGASWLCYYRALQQGPVSAVAPIDKMSVLVTVAFSYFFLHERLSRRAAAGLLAMTAGTVMMALL